MKKILRFSFLFLAFLLLLTGCNQNSSLASDSLDNIMSKIYKGISEDELPMYLENEKLTKDTIASYIGTSDIEWKEAIASESGVGSIAHSIVLIRMDDNATSKDIIDAKKKIEENVNPAKWICVEAEKVYVESNDKLIVVIMTFEDMADTLRNNFLELNVSILIFNSINLIYYNVYVNWKYNRFFNVIEKLITL